MKNLKAFTKHTLFTALIVSLSFFTSCDNDSETFTEQSVEFNEKTDPDPKVTVTVGMRLHRGKKWSDKNGVAPCTESFGVCSVRVEGATIEVKQGKIDLRFKKSLAVGNATARITFLEDVNATEGKIFISSEDDDFMFPSDIAKLFGVTDLVILADDYVTHVDANHPYGYVDVECMAK
jgi:hypothetical protein